MPDESVFEGLNTAYPVLEYPADNPNNAAAASLGERLFFDPILSVDSSISCGSCHKPELGFATNDKVTPGVGGVLGKRNSPSLLNVGFEPYFMREVGVPSVRPHQEVRLLKWGDIDLERKIISLSGKRNKSGRNRVVPLSAFVIEALSSFSKRKERSEYILSSSDKPYNRDFLSLLWSRYKKTSKVLEDGVTLYSWRHHGAVKVFEKTGSLLKLHQVMGHSDMKVSLTYLRGLEVKQLDVADLPDF